MIFLADSAIFYPYTFLARLFLSLCILLFADTVATQSLGEVLPIK